MRLEVESIEMSIIDTNKL